MNKYNKKQICMTWLALHEAAFIIFVFIISRGEGFS